MEFEGTKERKRVRRSRRERRQRCAAHAQPRCPWLCAWIRTEVLVKIVVVWSLGVVLERPVIAGVLLHGERDIVGRLDDVAAEPLVVHVVAVDHTRVDHALALHRHAVEHEAQVLGTVAQIGGLAPDQQPQDQILNLVAIT